MELNAILSKRLEKLIELKKDEDYKNSIPQQAEKMGIPYPTLVKYIKGDVKNCPATNILKIANYYNVSSDYLLGITDNPTTDKTLNFVCNYLGLSQTAVNNLRQLSTIKCKTISQIIECAEFLDIVNIIISAQYNKNLLYPSGDVIAHIIIDKLCGKNKTDTEIIINQIAEQVAQRGLAPFYKQEVFEDITTIFDKLTESGEL